VISIILGGIGLFLLGMVLMTESLKAAAGEALRDILQRFTGGRYSAFASGMALTALVQSSSATILATIGFVSAGLLTFSQAIGVLIGAAVGTTSTGWLVAFLGLKYSVSALALPLVGVGALLRLLTGGRTASLGMAIAGFGLIFVGIDTLQLGMQTLSERIDLSTLGYESFGNRLLLLLVGLMMTVVMQSSSAAVATTLAALHTGTIGFEQAAVLVIGQNVGTSVTAGLASLGASVPARRTALAHILFNAFSGAVAFVALPLFLTALELLQTRLALSDPAGIAIFHTAFNLTGAAILLPLTAPYAALIARLIPDPTPALTRNLDTSVRSIPPVAIEAARRTVRNVATVVLQSLRDRLTGEPGRARALDPLAAASEALTETRRFLSGIRSSPDAGEEYHRHLSVLHATDHLERMVSALHDPLPPRVLHQDQTLESWARELNASLVGPLRWLQEGADSLPEDGVERTSLALASARRTHRPAVLARTAAGDVDPQTALTHLDAMRWLDRLAYHSWRVVHHLGGGVDAVETPEDTEHDFGLKASGAVR
jgi:phosphate:Na+ symporter